MMTERDERELLRQLVDPETQRRAFEKVVNEYGQQMYWQIRRIVIDHDDADDVLQNAFVKAWSNIASFRSDSRLSTWLMRIAINEALDFKRKRRIDTVSADEQEGVANHLMADEYFDGDETQALLQEAVAQLPEVQRAVFNLRYYDDLKYSEISQILNTSEGALKASYHHAVKKITDFFHRHD